MKTKSSVKPNFHYLLLFAALVAVGCALASTTYAGSGNWNVDAAGNWSGTGNWSPAAVPGTAAGDVVGLNFNLTAARIITLDTAATVGTLNLGDPKSSFFGYTLSGGSTLTFNNSGNGANLVQATVGGAADTLSAPISLSDNLSIYNVNGLTMSGVISGSGFGLAKAGAGTLTLNGAAADAYTGPTTLGGGSLVIDFANATSPASGLINSSSTLYLGGGTLQVKQQSGVTTSQVFSNTTLNTNTTTAVIGTQVTSGALTVNLGAITNDVGATVDFTVPTGGAIATSAGNVNGIVGGWATTGNNVSSSSTGDFVATSGGNLATYGSYTTSGTPSGTTLASANYKGTFTTTASATINSFVETGDSQVGSGTTLTIGSGGIILHGGSAWLKAGSTTTSFLKSGLSTGELFVHTPNAGGTDWRIWDIIADGSVATRLVKDGPGFVGLENYNTYTGGTVVNGGTLAVGPNSSSPTFNGGGTACFRGPLTINPGGTVSLTIGDSLGYNSGVVTTPVNVNGGTLDVAVNANEGYISTFNLTGGTMSSSGGGAYNFSGSAGAINSLASPIVSTISGPISLRANGLTITTALGTVPSGIDLNISGAISQNGGTYNLTKAGAGTLELSGGNSFGGGITHNAGTLTLNNSAALGTGTLTISGGNLDSANGSLTIGNNNAQAWNSDFTFVGSQNLNLGTGAVTPSANRQVTVTTNTLTVGGVIGGGAVSLTKAGNGALTLSGLNTYTGGTVVNAGTLNLNTGGSTGCIRGTATVNSGGVLQLTAADAPGYGGGATALTNLNLTGGNLNLNGANNETLGGAVINLTGGSITGNASGNIDFLNNGSTLCALNTLASPVTSTISGVKFSPLRQGNATFTVATGTTPSGIDLDISSIIQVSPSGNIAGSSLIKAGAGYMRLSAANTYTNNTIISAGTLALGANGSISNSPNIILNSSGAVFDVTATTFNLRSNQTLTGIGTLNGTVNVASGGIVTAGTNTAGTLTLGDLTLNGTNTLNINPGAAQLNVIGANGLNPAGAANSVTINIGTSSIAPGTYTLITYSGSIQGTGFSAFKLGSTPGILFNYTLINDVANSSVDVQIVAVADSWTGGFSSEWSTSILSSPKNWQQSGSPVDYTDGSPVIFDDTATGTTTVDLSVADVSPATVLFNNTNASYTLQGSAAIAGSTGLIKSSPGTATINNTNKFTGSVTINAGTLAVNTITNGGGNCALGAGTNITLVGGTLSYTGGSASSDRSVSVSSPSTIGVTTGGTTLTLGGAITGAAGLTKTGGGTLVLTNAGNNYPSNNINAGTLSASSTAPLGTAGVLVAFGGGTLDLTGSAAISSGRIYTFNAGGGTIQVDNTAGVTLTSPATGTGGMAKTGNGALTLSGINTYSGGTTVGAGTLILNNGGATGCIRGTATVNSGGVLQLLAGDAIGYGGGASSLTNVSLSGGTLNVNNSGGNQTLGNTTINMTGGAITGLANANIDFFGGSSALYTFASSVSSTISGVPISPLRQGSTTFTVAAGTTPNGIDLDISSAMQSANATDPGGSVLTKAGPGYMRTSGQNTYTGGTAVSDGTLEIAGNNGIQNSASFTATSGGVLDLNATNLFVLNHSTAMASSRVITVDNATLLMTPNFEARFGNVTLRNGATWTGNRGLSGYDALLANTSAGAATVLVTNTSGTAASTMNGTGGIHLQGVQNFDVADVTGDTNADLMVNMVLGDTGLIGGTAGGINKKGAGTMTLAATNTYANATIITSGTLALAGTGSISNSATISIAAGATFDTSSQSTFNLGSGQTLAASGGGTAAVINGGTTVNLGSQTVSLTFTPTSFNGDLTHPALLVSQGALTFANNTINVTNASGTALGAGTYQLAQVTGGTINGTPNASVTVRGAGILASATASIQVSSGNVNLVVAKGNPTVTVTSSKNPSGYQDSIQFTATVSPVLGGTISFTTNGVAFDTEPLSSGSATSVATSALPRGNNPVAATFSPTDTTDYNSTIGMLSSPVSDTILDGNSGQEVTNHPPVAMAHNYNRVGNISLKILISDLVAGGTDADGDPVTFGGYKSLSTNGTTLFDDGTYIYYTNSLTQVPTNVPDAFLYWLSDGTGSANGGTGLGNPGLGTNTVFISIIQTNGQQTPGPGITVSGSSVSVTFFGVPGYLYDVQRNTNLGAGAGWVDITNVTTPTNGTFTITDTFPDIVPSLLPSPPPSAYYRLLVP